MRNIPDKVTGVTPYEAVEFNSFKNESLNAVIDTGQTPIEADSKQLQKAMAVYAGGGDFYSDSFPSPNTYDLLPVDTKQSPPSYFDGMTVRFIAGGTNTGASTIDVNGVGVKDVRLQNGSALPASAIFEDEFVELVFKDADDYFVLTSQSSAVSNPLPPGGFFEPNGVSFTRDSITDLTFKDGARFSAKNAPLDIELASDITKNITINWAEGNGGGKPNSVVISVNQTLHLFIISKEDGTADCGVDTSITAVNLLSDASGAGYIYYRRIHSIITNATSEIIDLTQFGNDIRYQSSQTIGSTTWGTSLSNVSLAIPGNVELRVDYVAEISGSNGDPNVYSISTSGRSAFNIFKDATGLSGTNVVSSSFVTNSRTIQVRATDDSVSGTVRVVNYSDNRIL